MKKILFALLFSMPLCSLSATAWAQDSRTLDRVIVTAGRIAESPRSVTSSVTVIPHEEIAKSQYDNLGGILRNYGIQVNSYSGNEGLGQVAIRGVRSSAMGSDLQGAVLMLVDGRRIGSDNLAMLPMVNVERIEIIRGPGSVQYGSSAIGGVINVITRRGPGADEAGEPKKYAGRLEAGGGSYDTYKTQAELAAQGGGIDFSGGVSWLTAHDYKTGGGHTYHNTGNDYRLGYSLNLGYSFNEENRLGLTMLGVRNDGAGSPNELRQNDFLSYSDRSNHSLDFVYDGGWADWGLEWRARYFNGKDSYLSEDPNPFGMGRYESETSYQGLQGQLSWNKAFLTLTGGVDYLYYDTDVVSAHQRNKYYNAGSFLLAKLAFSDDLLVLSGGVRYDNYDLRYEGRNADLNHTTPSVGLAVNPLDWLTLRANYGEAYRVPQGQEMLGFDGGWRNYLGNPDLKPEEGKSWDVGFAIHKNSLNLGVTWFRTDYENKIVTRQVGWDSQYCNLDGKSRFQGLEVQADYDLGELFDWPFMLRPYLNMTTLFKYEDENGSHLENVSRHDIAYGLGFEHPDWGMTADLRFTYYGRQKQTDFGTAAGAWMDGGPVSVGPSTVVDLFVSKSIYSFENAGTLKLKGEIRNMFDEDYQTIFAYPMPGRSFYLGMEYEF
ncbi:MAG: TonB-dependent receptor [Desulfovibrionaceae bacterium]|nr:TonB-dependent receptor [Desulfovibrionaceae bacterium]